MSHRYDDDTQQQWLREQALGDAVRWRATQPTGSPFHHSQAHDVIQVAEVFYRWVLTGRQRDFLTLTASGLQLIHPSPDSLRGNLSMANPQVPVGYQFSLTVAPVDVLGNPVSDTLTWTSSDVTGATTLTVNDATTLVVTVAVPGPGTLTDVVITATDANNNTGSYTFDVVADVATALSFTASAPVKIPTA